MARYEYRWQTHICGYSFQLAQIDSETYVSIDNLSWKRDVVFHFSIPLFGFLSIVSLLFLLLGMLGCYRFCKKREKGREAD